MIKLNFMRERKKNKCLLISSHILATTPDYTAVYVPELGHALDSNETDIPEDLEAVKLHRG